MTKEISKVTERACPNCRQVARQEIIEQAVFDFNCPLCDKVRISEFIVVRKKECNLNIHKGDK